MRADEVNVTEFTSLSMISSTVFGAKQELIKLNLFSSENLASGN